LGAANTVLAFSTPQHTIIRTGSYTAILDQELYQDAIHLTRSGARPQPEGNVPVAMESEFLLGTDCRGLQARKNARLASHQ